jgi:hypothetical protein
MTDGINWHVVFDIRCPCSNYSPNCTSCTCYDCDPNHLPPITGSLGTLGCELTLCQRALNHEDQPAYEPWDVVMNHNGTTKFAALVGGIGHTCGMAFSSSDDGAHWTKEEHECTIPGYNSNCVLATDTNYLYHDFPLGYPAAANHTFRHLNSTIYSAVDGTTRLSPVGTVADPAAEFGNRVGGQVEVQPQDHW